MKKTHLNTLSTETENILFRLNHEFIASNVKVQKKAIREDSPYSKTINDAISSYKEFLLYYNLKLKEADVTRRSLIKDLDLDLWVSCENKTNRELLKEGSSPYAYDAKEGRIDIHHIGQGFDAPFAELTIEEHKFYGNSGLLHDQKIESWRNDKAKLNQFQNERIRYWEKRVRNDISYIRMKEFKELEVRTFSKLNENSAAVNIALEGIFEELPVEDLTYISNLAESYAMVKQIGAKSINDFVNKKYDDGAVTCSFCGESDYVSHGKYKTSGENIKRYKCKKCGKIFTQVNNCIISGSNLSFMEWIRFIDCLYSGYSVSKTATVCGLSENAVQANRYKVFYALKLLDDKVKLSGNIVIDETYRDTSFKGNHANGNPNMNRKARKRGGENHTPGISKEKVCVVCAMDDNGNSVAHIAGLGMPSSSRLIVALEKSIDTENVTSLYTDMEGALNLFAKRMKLPILRAKQLNKGGKKATKQEITPTVLLVNRYLQKMNSYHSRLDKFIDSFSGVSSQFLAGYLYLFAWKERNKDRDKYEAYKELLEIMTERNKQLQSDLINSGGFMPNPFKTEHIAKKRFLNQSRADGIYALHAQGKTYKTIAKIYKMSPKGIARIVQKYNALNLGYKTEREKEKERKQLELSLKNKKENLWAKRCVEIYEQSKEWTGNKNEFIDKMVKRYNFSKQTIKNNISDGRRIFALKEAFFVGNTYEIAELHEIYQEVYSRFKELRENDKYGVLESYRIIADEYNYTPGNIVRIIDIMKKDAEEYFNRDKIRLSPKETTKRDKAIFSDFVRWKGTKENFLKWAAKKYNTSERNVQCSIHYCLVANSKRYEFI